MWNNNTTLVGIDTETTGLSRTDYPFAVSLCDDSGNNILYEWDVDPMTRIPQVNRDNIRSIHLHCQGKTLVFHNQIFDLLKLDKVGVKLQWRFNSFDTSVTSHVIDSGRHRFMKGRLKELSSFYLDIHDDDQKELQKATISARHKAKKLGWNIAQPETGQKNHVLRDYWVPKAIAKHEQYDLDHPWWTVLSRYANLDTERTVLLHLLFQKVMAKWESDDLRHGILKRERRLTNVLYDMAKLGINVFPDKIEKELREFNIRMIQAVKVMRNIVIDDSFNVESSIQLSNALFNILKLPKMKKTATGNYSTDKSVRESLTEYVESKALKKRTKLLGLGKQIIFVKRWNDYKDCNNLTKYLSSYREFTQDSKVYPSLDQTGTSTTRIASHDPNGQNVKKADEERGVVGLRNVFGPDYKRMWLCLDYSQLQLRIFAYLTQEQSMIEAFERGYDFHGFIASKIFDKDIKEITKLERRIGKNVNFGFIFGAAPAKIEATAGVSGLWDTVCKMFPSAHSYMARVKSQVMRDGYITTPHGYRLYVDQPHKGVNYIVQGCEGDIVKEGMLLCENFLSELQAGGFTGNMLFQVHDELIFDFPIRGRCRKPSGCWCNHHAEYPQRIVKELKRLMEKPGMDVGMVTPVDVEWTQTNWAETKEYVL